MHCTLLTGALLAPAAIVSLAVANAPVTTAFTYQGELQQGGTPFDGAADLRFRLYDDMLGASQVGPELVANGVNVTEGRFTIDLDFGAVFDGTEVELSLIHI